MEEERNLKMIRNIKDNYRQVEKFIVEQLYMKNDLHGTTIGTEREDIWEQLFEMVLPKKFVMEHSVFIIDSNGNVSNEVDLAIMDETYTPYIFRYGRLKFIPIEAVAAVVECKSKNVGEKKIKIWQKRIDELRTRGKSIARMANQIVDSTVATQKSTRPIRILCVLGDVKDDIKNLFDFVLIAKKDNENKGKRSRIEVIFNASMDLYEFRMAHSTVMEHYKFIEMHLEGIYAVLSGKGLYDGLKDVEKYRINKVVKMVQEQEKRHKNPKLSLQPQRREREKP